LPCHGIDARREAVEDQLSLQGHAVLLGDPDGGGVQRVDERDKAVDREIREAEVARGASRLNPQSLAPPPAAEDVADLDLLDPFDGFLIKSAEANEATGGPVKHRPQAVPARTPFNMARSR